MRLRPDLRAANTLLTLGNSPVALNCAESAFTLDNGLRGVFHLSR